MGNCESYTDGIEELPGAREKSYSSSGTAVLFDRIDVLKKRNALLEQNMLESKTKQEELESQMADLKDENKQFQQEHDEVESVVTGFEHAMDKVVAEKDAVIAELRVRGGWLRMCAFVNCNPQLRCATRQLFPLPHSPSTNITFLHVHPHHNTCRRSYPKLQLQSRVPCLKQRTSTRR